jgi:hypothetical protein
VTFDVRWPNEKRVEYELTDRFDEMRGNKWQIEQFGLSRIS